MMALVISDGVWQALIAALLAGWIEWIRRKHNAKLDAIIKTVNGQSLAQHKLNAELSRWKAEQTGQLDHIAAAEAAELLYAAQQKKQEKDED